MTAGHSSQVFAHAGRNHSSVCVCKGRGGGDRHRWNITTQGFSTVPSLDPSCWMCTNGKGLRTVKGFLREHCSHEATPGVACMKVSSRLLCVLWGRFRKKTACLRDLLPGRTVLGPGRSVLGPGQTVLGPERGCSDATRSLMHCAAAHTPMLSFSCFLQEPGTIYFGHTK